MSQKTIWAATLTKAVVMQWSAVVGVAAVAGLLGGVAAGESALGGGAAVALPNTLLAVWMLPRLKSAGPNAAVHLMVAEGLKLAGTVALLVGLVVVVGKALVWPAMIAGMVVSIVGQWLALLVTKRY